VTQPARGPRPVGRQALNALRSEWDSIADHRFRQIESGTDLTYGAFLVPLIVKLAGTLEGRTVVDAGCGSGQVACSLAREASFVFGVDLSQRQVDLARRHNPDPHVLYECAAFEEWTTRNAGLEADVVVASMTLMDVPDLDEFVAAVSATLTPRGRFVATLTHPLFWPLYWGYFDASWFRYDEEIFVQAPFAITLAQDTAFMTTHIHRPLGRYTRTLEKHGLSLTALVEPMPDPNLMGRYPKRWRYPRYLGFVATRS